MHAPISQKNLTFLLVFRFVKTDDASFVRRFGVTQFPTIMYFEKQAASIYEGNASF